MLTELIARLVNLVLLIASVAWLCTATDWEPFIATVTLAGTMLTLEIREYNRAKASEKNETDSGLKTETPQVEVEAPTKVDLVLWRKYITHFPPDGAVFRFWKEHDIAAPFHRSLVEPLWQYCDNWKGASFEFIHPELEIARTAFDQKVRKFTSSLANETSPCGMDTFSMGFKDIEDRPWMLKTQERLNGLSTEVADTYEAFYRVGRRIFKNEEPA